MRLWISVLLLSLSSLAIANPKVHEFKLDNGLRVIIKEDHRAPVMVSQIWYKVGSVDEYAGVTGLSHALEHMMFKGTRKVGRGQFSRIISANGGSENAFTSRDYTAYFELLASDRLEIALELEADRMRNLVLDPAEFKKEIEVVKEERRLRTEDKASGYVWEQFVTTAYRASPNGNPVIGWMNDLDQMTVKDLRAWYERFYAPNNAVLVIVGDVRPQPTMALVKKHFGAIPPSKLVTHKRPVEPPQRGETRVNIEFPARQPYVLMGYKTPVMRQDDEWEPYALYVLSAILDGGDSARLSKELVRGQKLAASASAEYSPYGRLPAMFLLSGTPTGKNKTAKVESALRRQIARMREELVSQAELDRVVTQLVASKVFEQDSIMNQATELGSLATIGLDWRVLDKEVDRIRAVTPEQVRSVARRYLTDTNLTVATLKPLPLSKRKPRKRGPSGSLHH